MRAFSSTLLLLPRACNCTNTSRRWQNANVGEIVRVCVSVVWLIRQWVEPGAFFPRENVAA